MTATMATMSPALRKVMQAKIDIMLGKEPFFGAVVGRMPIVEDPGCGTAWTDGRRIGVDPAFVERISQQEVAWVLCHEIGHVVGQHPWRRDGRDPKRWNMATDHVINLGLARLGWDPPAGVQVLADPQFTGLSPEQVYARLGEAGGGGGDDGQGDGGAGDGEGLPGPGEVRDDPGPSEGDARTADQAAADWQVAAVQAEQVSRMAGQGGGPWGAASAMAGSGVDYAAAMAAWVQRMVPDDYSWTRPAARWMPAGLYLPSLRATRCGGIVVAIDTSASVSDAELGTFVGDLQAIVDAVRPAWIKVLWASSRVDAVEELEDGEGLPSVRPSVVRGGTDFRPAFDMVEAEGWEPAGMVYLTDGEGLAPAEPPAWPTLWVVTRSGQQGPWGETIRMGG